MKVLMINSVCGVRSTGRLCVELADKLIKDGHEVRIAYGRESVPDKYKDISVRIGDNLSLYLNALKVRFFDNEGFNAGFATKKFLKWAEEYNPDLLWLHNLHGYYLNVKLLFEWIKSRPNMKVKWTLHDCWAFTGHCAHFSVAKCYKWKTQCDKCVLKNSYPSSYFADKSKFNFNLKKEIFTSVQDMTIITPSNWLADLVGQSFLKDYPVEVVYNTVNTNIFTKRSSDFKSRYGLNDKIIILGVATAWSKNKGIDDFINLAKLLDDRYKIVLVGLTKKQIRKIPYEILAIERTDNAIELAEIYTAADVFVNPSREETFGLTTLEATSCGTFPIVYKDTACEEIVNLYGGVAVCQSVDALLSEIKNLKV